MRRAVPSALVLPLLLAGPAGAEVQVRVTNGRVALEAKGAPLSDVLDRLAKQTGMKVTYDGAPQRTPVSLTLIDRTPAEAVLGLLDGLGLNYAFRMDATGTRIETLLIAGTAPTAPAGGLASAPAPRAAPVYTPPEPAEPEEEEPVEEETDADTADKDDGAAVLPPGVRPPQTQPGAQPGVNPQAPGQVPTRSFGPGVLGTATRPEFPSPLSPPVPPFLGNPPPTQPQTEAEPDDDAGDDDVQ